MTSLSLTQKSEKTTKKLKKTRNSLDFSKSIAYCPRWKEDSQDVGEDVLFFLPYTVGAYDVFLH